jgi:hypothetical protein
MTLKYYEATVKYGEKGAIHMPLFRKDKGPLRSAVDGHPVRMQDVFEMQEMAPKRVRQIKTQVDVCVHFLCQMKCD